MPETTRYAARKASGLQLPVGGEYQRFDNLDDAQRAAERVAE